MSRGHHRDPRRPPDRVRRHLHRRHARARRADARAGRRRRPHRRQHHAGLLGSDDHAVDPRRPRGLHAGGGRGRQGRRRDRHPHPRHRGHLAGHRVGQRPDDGGPLQRRPLLRAHVRRVRHRVAGDARRGHRPGVDPLRQLRRRRHPVHLHQRLHDRLRPDAHGRRHGRRAGRRGLRRRRRADGRAARQLAPEPDPAVRAARHRRHGHAAAPVHGPARHHAVDDDARLAQRGRLRLVPDRRAAPLRDDRVQSSRSTRPTGTWTSTPCARARSSSARSRSTAAASTWATCTRCRATARSPATRPTCPAPSRSRSRSSRA